MDKLIAMACIGEMANRHNELVEYRALLPTFVHGLSEYNARDDALAEMACAVWREAMDLVADHFGVNLQPKREVVDVDALRAQAAERSRPAEPAYR